MQNCLSSDSWTTWHGPCRKHRSFLYTNLFHRNVFTSPSNRSTHYNMHSQCDLCRMILSCTSIWQCDYRWGTDWMLGLLTTCIHHLELYFTDHWHTQTSVLSLLQASLAVCWQQLLPREIL
jgi:hypothetical protein